MFERFTDRARTVMVLANEESKRWGQAYIGSEHILFGIVSEGTGTALHALTYYAKPRKFKSLLKKLGKHGPVRALGTERHQGQRAKELIDYAVAEARRLGHDYVGTEHLLLGILQEDAGLGAQVIRKLGVELGKIKCDVYGLLGRDPESPYVNRYVPAGSAAIEPHKNSASFIFGQACRVACRFNQHQVDTEHLLIAMAREHNCAAAVILKSLDVDVPVLIYNIESVSEVGHARSALSDMPKAPLVESVFEFATELARSLSSRYVGTEHLLLGLLLKREGLAVKSLDDLGITFEQVRERVRELT